MTSKRIGIGVAIVGAVAVAGAVVFVACGSGSTSNRSERRSASTTGTTAPVTTPTTVAPQTVPVPPVPPPSPTAGPPPPITVPPGETASPQTTPQPPAATKPPTTKPPTTTKPSSTTQPSSTTKPGAVTKKTVVFSPPGAPKRKGDLVLPHEHANTIVVLVHANDDSGSRKQMRGWADFYAQHGYPSFAIDYQLTTTLAAPVYPKPQTDVKAAVQFLRGRAGALGLDPGRIVVQGFEAGAALGAQALVTPNDAFFEGPRRYPDQSDEPAGFIGFYGIYDGARKDPQVYYGGPLDSPDPKVQQRVAKANSIAQAGNAAGPALLVQGEADNPDVVASATAFRDALQAAGKDVTLNLVPGAGPGFDQDTTGALTPEGQQAAQQVLDWLNARFPKS